MNQLLTFSFLLLFIQVICSTAYGQTGGAIVPITAQESADEADNYVGYSGFRETYFSKQDLQTLLPKSADGLRFYIGREETNQYYTDIIAVAFDKDGNELSTYLVSKASDMDPAMTSIQKSKSFCERCVQNLGNSFAPFFSDFNKSLVFDMLNISGCTGIRVRSSGIPLGRYEILKTISIGAVSKNGNTLTDLDDEYLKYMEPCPTECGDSGGKYLFDPKK